MPGVWRDKAGQPARISPPMQMGYKLPAPARSLAMACGPAWEHRMTTDNHDPFALGGDQDELATPEQLAALDFEPVEDLDGVMRALSNPQWGQTIKAIGQDLRIAAKLLEKTKAEMIGVSRKLD